MKKKTMQRIILLLLLIVFVSACVKEEEEVVEVISSSVGNEKSAIQSAKEWYGAKKKGEAIQLKAMIREVENKDKSIPRRLKPSWNRSFVKENSEYRVVETPLIGVKLYNMVSEDCYKKSQEADGPGYLHSTTNLVVKTDKKTGVTQGFVMTIVPDLKYLELSDFKPFEKNCYLERDKEFSGFIFYYDLEGNYVNSWYYRNGKAYAGTIKENAPKIELRSDECLCLEVYIVERTCYYTLAGNEVTHKECYITDIELIWVCVCYDTEGNGGYNGGGGGGYGGGGGGGYDDDDEDDDGPPPPPPVRVYLTGITMMTIMEAYVLNVEIVNGTSDHTSIEFRINNETLQNANVLYCNEIAKKVGVFPTKAIVTFANGESAESNEWPVEVQFPDVSTIMSNPDILNAMSAAWEETKSAASADGRSERGFPIYVDTEIMSYECGAVVSGDPVECGPGTEASITLSGEYRIFDSPLMGHRYVVAFFHTHTPLTYCSGDDSRAVGPSPPDENSALSGIPGLVYDYDGYDVPGYGHGIGAGHELHINAHVYTYGSSRRPTF